MDNEIEHTELFTEDFNEEEETRVFVPKMERIDDQNWWERMAPRLDLTVNEVDLVGMMEA